MPRLILYASLLLLGFTATGLAQTLHVGQQEVDTGDREAMAALVERCSTLAAEEADAATTASFTRRTPTEAGEPTEAESANDGTGPSEELPDMGSETDAAPDRSLLAIDIEALASGGGGQTRAGEGSGTGTRPAEESDQQGGFEISAVTLRSCREAGIVY